MDSRDKARRSHKKIFRRFIKMMSIKLYMINLNDKEESEILLIPNLNKDIGLAFSKIQD